MYSKLRSVSLWHDSKKLIDQIHLTDQFDLAEQDATLHFYWGDRASSWSGTAGLTAAAQVAFVPQSAQAADPAALGAASLNATSTVLGEGSIDADEIDTYAIELVAGQTYLFSARGTGTNPLIDARVFVYDDTLTATLGHDDDGGDVWNSLLTYTATYTGTHHIGVGTWPGVGLTGSYTLDAVTYPGTDTVSEDYSDPSLLTPLDLNGVTFGFIDDPSFGTGFYGPFFGEVDSYRLEVEAGKYYTIKMSGGIDYASNYLESGFNLPPGEVDPRLHLYGPDFSFVAFNDDIDPVFLSDFNAAIGFFAEVSGTYYLDVYSWAPWTGGYSLVTQTIDPADLADVSPLDAINGVNAANVPFDANNTAYVYFAEAGDNLGEEVVFGEPMTSIGWSAFLKQQIMQALEQFEKILGVNYEITTDISQATFRLVNGVTDSGQGNGYAVPFNPDFGDRQGVMVLVNNPPSQPLSFLPGGQLFEGFLHELGHLHGLMHPHEAGSSGSDIMAGVVAYVGSYGIYDLNQGLYTIESYNWGWPLHPDGPVPPDPVLFDTHGHMASLGAFDIAVLQQRYGANNTYATGNDTYVLKDVERPGTFYETIWDTGGTDVISYSGNRAARIDLTAATLDYSPTGGGVVSFVDDIHGGFTIANGVVIENATGGGGADVLVGNAAANTLTGGNGDDTLSGLAGDDVLAGGNGDDALDGGADNDTLAGGNGLDMLDGGDGNDALEGGNNDDRLIGGIGDDTLEGGNGEDILIGGAGNDVLAGGNNQDMFVFTDLGGFDIVTDFRRGHDKIDLSGIDAVAGGGDDPFDWIGSGAFSGEAGELRIYSAAGNHFAAGDVDGDGIADVTIRTNVLLTSSDFIA